MGSRQGVHGACQLQPLRDGSSALLGASPSQPALTRKHTHARTCTHMRSHAHTHPPTLACTHTHSHAHAHSHTLTCAVTHSHTHAHMQSHVLTRTHTHSHTCPYPLSRMCSHAHLHTHTLALTLTCSHTHAHMQSRVLACTLTPTHPPRPHTHLYTHLHAHAQSHVLAHPPTRLHTHTLTCTLTHSHVLAHPHTRLHTHTLTRTCAHAQERADSRCSRSIQLERPNAERCVGVETGGPGVPPEPGVTSLSAEHRPTKCSRLVKKPGQLIATLDQTPSSFPARLSSRLRGNHSREVGELGQGHRARDAGHSDSGLGRPHLALLGAPGRRKPGDTRASRLVSAEGPSAARVASSDTAQGRTGWPRGGQASRTCV